MTTGDNVVTNDRFYLLYFDPVIILISSGSLLALLTSFQASCMEAPYLFKLRLIVLVCFGLFEVKVSAVVLKGWVSFYAGVRHYTREVFFLAVGGWWLTSSSI